MKDNNNNSKNVSFDAKGEVLGRLATRVATSLRGKDRPEFEYHLDLGINVTIKNIDQLKITGNKLEDKIYYRYSGYPGGIKEQTMKKKYEKDPQQFFRDVVYKMLPKNRLRDKMINRLKFN